MKTDKVKIELIESYKLELRQRDKCLNWKHNDGIPDQIEY